MYRCQSAHKLVELDAHFRLFTRFHPRTVVDLAAAPGGFSQVALQLMQNKDVSLSSSLALPPLVIAVDQRAIEPLPGLVAVRGNILQHKQVLQTVQRSLQSPPAPTPSHRPVGSSTPRRVVEMVLHDGVSVVKGQHAFSVTYAQNQMALSTLLLASKLFAQLGPSPTGESESSAHRQASPSSSARGTKAGERAMDASGRSSLSVCFVSKVLRSSHLTQVLTATQALFRHVTVFKPPSSRAESKETYVVATHFLPRHWQQLQTSAPDLHGKGKAKRSTLQIHPAVFSMPPAAEDCSDARHLVWNCLGCGRTCMGQQPCTLCGVFQCN